jgi:hypothetical protein
VYTGWDKAITNDFNLSKYPNCHPPNDFESVIEQLLKLGGLDIIIVHKVFEVQVTQRFPTFVENFIDDRIQVPVLTILGNFHDTWLRKNCGLSGREVRSNS